MGTFIGDNKLAKIYIGDTKVKKIYIGDSKTWSGASLVDYHVDGNVVQQEVDEGQSILTYTPTKSGWTFTGWREDNTASSSVLSEKVATGEPMAVYAVFQANVTVTYYNNSTTASSQTKQRYYNNGNVVNPTFALSQAGVTSWSARGWSTNNTGNAGITYNNGATFTRDSNITLYGLYQRTVTVSYNGNGATGGSTSSSTGTAYRNASGTGINASISIRANGFSKSNGTFYRWRTTSTGGTVYKAGATYSSVSDMTLYAYWLTTTVAFNYTGGMQSFTALANFTYTLKVYGAQGGGSAGGKGGYSTGRVKFTSNTALYIGVGQQGIQNGSTLTGGYNGGGNGAYGSSGGGSGGGGATHIAKSNNRGVLANYNSYRTEVLLVGGGGGGVATTALGGSGGGTNGGNEHRQYAPSGYDGYGGTQTAGGAKGASNASAGSFGKGGNAYTDGNRSAGGGGGGWFGGGGGYGGSIAGYDGNGGGGSGYIGGVTSGTGSTSNGQRSGNGYAEITIYATD